MPSDVTAELRPTWWSTRRSGRCVGAPRGGVLRFGGVPYARRRTLGLARAGRRGREPLDATATRRGAAAGRRRARPRARDDPDRAGRGLPHRRGRARPSLDARVPGARLGARRQLPDRRRRRSPTYDGARARRASGVVVVGVNYRLGALGWLAADGRADRTSALRDLRAAVEWVRAASRAFGGDPDRIVLMGESAGAGCHRAPARGDRRRCPWRARSSRAARPRGPSTPPPSSGWASSCSTPPGCATSAALRDLPLAALLDAQEQTVAGRAGKVGMMPFHPWVDGDLLVRPAVHASARPRCRSWWARTRTRWSCSATRCRCCPTRSR